MTFISALSSLALSAFLSATVLPGSSELVLGGLLTQWPDQALALVAIATIANVAGSTVNWWLGLNVQRFAGRRWFPVTQQNLDTAQQRFQAWGSWALLLSWLPLIGDAFTVAAGVLKVPLVRFLPLVALGKGARYVAIAAGFSLWI